MGWSVYVGGMSQILEWFGIGKLHYGEIVTMMYLKIALSDYLTLFNSRTKGMCWMSRPSNVLLFAAAFATVVSTLLAIFWPAGNSGNSDNSMMPISLALAGFVWGYTFLWSFLQDFGKIACYWAMEKCGLIQTMEVITSKDLVGLSTSITA
jgi:H+-transporting ATPase